MRASLNEVDRFGMQTVDAMKHLVVANRYLQALVVLYSAIDTLARVDLESVNVTRSDFCRWVDTYVVPEKLIGCTAQDLYAARCAIVHSSATESRLSREGHASELWYVTSPRFADSLQLHAQKVGANAKVVHFTSIVAAFTEGVINFSQVLATNPDLERRCAERMKRWLQFLTMVADEQFNDRSEI